MCSKKQETLQDLIETDSHECETIIWKRLKTSQICIGVIIVLSM